MGLIAAGYERPTTGRGRVSHRLKARSPHGQMLGFIDKHAILSRPHDLHIVEPSRSLARHVQQDFDCRGFGQVWGEENTTPAVSPLPGSRTPDRLARRVQQLHANARRLALHVLRSHVRGDLVHTEANRLGELRLA